MKTDADDKTSIVSVITVARGALELAITPDSNSTALNSTKKFTTSCKRHTIQLNTS